MAHISSPRRYASVHVTPQGEGDARPTAFRIIQDNNVVGRLGDKTILVTGGTNGLGVDVVRQLAKTSARVFFTARSSSKGEAVKRRILEESRTDDALKGARLEILEMDLQSLSSVRTAAEDFLKRSSQLNVLISNAGVAMTPHVITEDGHEQQLQVNHLGHFLLFQRLKSTLLDSATQGFGSRVVCVSSLAHIFNSVLIGDYDLANAEGGYSPVTSYASSKTANIWMANELERRYGKKHVHAVSVHPASGGIITGLEDTHDPSVKPLMRQYLQMEHIKHAMKSVAQGAATTVLAAIGKDFEGIGGFYMEDCAISPPLPKDALPGTPRYMPWAYDPEGEKQLCADLLKMVGVEESE